MAYIGHSPVRDVRDFRGVASAVAQAPLFGRCALIAIATAVAILALSDAGISTSSAPQTVAGAKGDRIAPPVTAASVSGGYRHDPATQTTTVERGAAVPLSAQSPMLAASK